MATLWRLIPTKYSDVCGGDGLTTMGHERRYAGPSIVTNVYHSGKKLFQMAATGSPCLFEHLYFRTTYDDGDEG